MGWAQNGKGACIKKKGVNRICSFYFRLNKNGLGPKQEVVCMKKSGVNSFSILL